MSIIRNKLIYEKEKAVIRYNNLNRRFVRQPVVFSMDDTIRTIREKRASIARYGDGEFDIIFGRTEGYQGCNKKLSNRLREILRCNHISERFLVGIPDCFAGLEQFIPAAQLHWKIRLEKERARWVRCLNTKYPYYNAQVTRFYFDWVDKSRCETWYADLKAIWTGENILLVEGEKSRVGVGNHIFDNAASIRRILCPAKNAFDYYDEILKEIFAQAGRGDLILMALGPTATVLAYDLFQEGYWAFDAGHFDLEYEWMKRKVTEKIKIEGKYVNEVEQGDIVSDTLVNEQYLNEIVARVGI